MRRGAGERGGGISRGRVKQSELSGNQPCIPQSSFRHVGGVRVRAVCARVCLCMYVHACACVSVSVCAHTHVSCVCVCW